MDRHPLQPSIVFDLFCYLATWSFIRCFYYKHKREQQIKIIKPENGACTSIHPHLFRYHIKSQIKPAKHSMQYQPTTLVYCIVFLSSLFVSSCLKYNWERSHPDTHGLKASAGQMRVCAYNTVLLPTASDCPPGYKPSRANCREALDRGVFHILRQQEFSSTVAFSLPLDHEALTGEEFRQQFRYAISPSSLNCTTFRVVTGVLVTFLIILLLTWSLSLGGQPALGRHLPQPMSA